MVRALLAPSDVMTLCPNTLRLEPMDAQKKRIVYGDEGEGRGLGMAIRLDSFPLESHALTILANRVMLTSRPRRAPSTFVWTPSSTRRSGSRASRAFPTGSASASRGGETTRRAPRRSSTATFRPSTSRTPRASRLSSLRSKERAKKFLSLAWVSHQGGIGIRSCTGI